MIERGITGLLPAFFGQRMIGDPDNGYSTPAWVDQIQLPGESFSIRRCIPLDREESERMEPIMTEMRIRDPRAYRILELYWGHGWTDSKIAHSSTFKSTSRDIERERLHAQSKVEERMNTV